MVKVKLQKPHCGAAFTFQRVITKGGENGSPPLVKAPVNMAFFTGDCTEEFFVSFPVAGIETAITDHFVMLFRDMPDKTLYELHDRNRFLHILSIFVPAVMEGDRITVIPVNPGRGDNRTAEIAADVFNDGFRVAPAGPGIYVEPFFMLPVTEGLDFFKGRPNSGFQFI